MSQRIIRGLVVVLLGIPGSAWAQQDAINLSQATVYNSPKDIASWPITTTITRLEMQPTGAPKEGVSLTFPAQSTWPDYTPPGWEGSLQYTVWAVLKINGQWVTSGFIQMWRGRVSTGAPILTDFARNWAYDSRWGPMYGYQPQVGEQMGFFVSAGNARGTTTVTSVRERSNVVLVNLPANDTGVFTNFFIPTTPLLWQNTSTRQVTAWQMGGSGGSVLQDWGYVSSSGVPGWTIVATGDFDGDGYQDVVWQNDVTRQVTVWYMVGTAFKGWNYISSGSVPGWSVVGSGDFNSDGKPDLVWQNDSTGEILVWYLFGAQGNMFLTWSYLSNGLPVPAGWKVVAVADFNGDGKPDVVGQNDSTRQLAIAYMGGGGGNVVLNYVTLGGVAGWRVVGAKDFDRDGRPDLVWQNDSTAQVTVWYMDGAQGDTMRSWNYLSSSNLMGWRALAR